MSRSRLGRLMGTAACLALFGLTHLLAAEPRPDKSGRFETTTVWPAAPRNRPNYRIPALLLAPNGDLLALAEKRNDGPGDLGNHDLVMKRSRDKGRSWDPEVVLFDDGDNTSTDITLALDAQRGVIWLFFLRDKVKYHCMSSADSGFTWSQPRSIHAEVTKPEWDRFGQDSRKRTSTEAPAAKEKHQGTFWNDDWVQRYGVGPGAGAIQVSQGSKVGRILVPARHLERDGSRPSRSFSHVFYSDDHGQTWHLGPNVIPDGNECRLLELANGDILMNARDADNRDRPDKLVRRIAVSHDGGDTWEAAFVDHQLTCPQCHAGLRRFTTAAEHDKNRILFSNPNNGYRQEKHPYGRINMSVRISDDEGRTWTAGKIVYPFASSYSDMAVLPDMTIGMVYERGPQRSTHYWDEVQFVRFDLAWLTDGREALRPHVND